MCGVSPRFSWITRTAPLGDDAVASSPISSPFGPGKRISPFVPAAVVGEPLVLDPDVVAGAAVVADVAPDVVARVVVASVEAAPWLPASSPHAASAATAAG